MSFLVTLFQCCFHLELLHSNLRSCQVASKPKATTRNYIKVTKTQRTQLGAGLHDTIYLQKKLQIYFTAN